MRKFNVIIEDNGKFVPYDIMEYLINKWESSDIKPYSFKEVREFIKKEAMYQWWSRCQYEIIISDWPSSSKEEKWDVYRQIMMNIENITILLMMNLKDYSYAKKAMKKQKSSSQD